jgi:thioester reductase-like protein
MTEHFTAFVTGAGGLVGAEVVARLAGAGHRVIGLVHHNTDLVRNNGRKVAARDLRLVKGDVTEPGLGIPALGEKIDRIVHCAAITDFGRPDEVYRSINLNGTDNVIKFAAAEGGIPLVHVSTAYVCGERDGESKLRAELLVRKAAADGLPVTVVRPSIVTGDARTGVVRDFKNLYVVLKMITEGKARSLPGHYDASIDLVPVDYVADVIADATQRFAEAEGQTLHAVGTQLRLRDVSDTLAEFPSFHVPNYVAPASFDADRLPGLEKLYYQRILSLYEGYFRRRVQFDDTAAAAFSRRRRPAGGRAYLRKLLDHAVKVGYLGSALPTIPQALAGLQRSNR